MRQELERQAIAIVLLVLILVSFLGNASGPLGWVAFFYSLIVLRNSVASIGKLHQLLSSRLGSADSEQKASSFSQTVVTSLRLLFLSRFTPIVVYLVSSQ
jgi:ammonia channel protein AmtB